MSVTNPSPALFHAEVSRTKRFLLILAGVLVLIALVSSGTGAYLVTRPFPPTSGRLTVPGLRAPVQVIRDRWGVPHIFAENAHDLIFAQGYVHAQDRLWLMEFNRRVAAGRLSEIFGEATLESDRFLRTIGLRRAAEGVLSYLDPETREAVGTYSAGVNAFIAQHASALPIEFVLLRFRPEPWTPVDSLAFGEVMSWVLSGNWKAELLRAHLLARFGVEGMRYLVPPYPGDAPVIVPPEADYRRWNTAAVLQLLALGHQVSGIGSNNWVIGGSHTATGRPLLANDPHLEAQMPSIWYEMHLSGGPYDVTGSTFPGVPGVIVGHNAHIAWGVTNAGPDVQDLYIERFHPTDPTKYLYRGQWEQATLIREEINVKGRPQPVVETVRITRHGPILNSVVDGLDAFLALRWTALAPGATAAAVLRIDRARDWNEFRDALRLWAVPAQNFVYADQKGNIGYQLPGRIPIRAKGDGLLPVPGWTGEYEWTGYIPFDDLPSVLNPQRGYIVTANNRIVPEGYKQFISYDWDPGFRAKRITAMLTAKPRISMDDIKKMQLDVTSLPGEAIVSTLQDVRVGGEPAASLLKELQAWDGVLRADSRAAAIYEAFRLALVRLVFQDVLGPDLYKRYLGWSDAWQLVLMRLLRDPSSRWWGPDGRDSVVANALHEANDTLTRRLGADRTRWTWGQLHVMRFVHPIGTMKAFAWIFNATAPPTGGDLFTVNNGGFKPQTFEQTVVASYRQIIDLEDWDRSVSIHTTGQSGLPFHRHYRDFVSMWATGQYHPMLFSRPRIQEASAGTLTLTPP